jgi:hypothetical protein
MNIKPHYVLQMLRLYILGLFEIAMSAGSALKLLKDDHQHTHDMNISADQLNLPPSQPIPEADRDRDKRPVKSKNTALRASGINAGLLEFNIIVGKRERKPYNPHAMTVDTSNIPMVPFHSSFAVAWDCGGLSRVIAEDSLFDYIST